MHKKKIPDKLTVYIPQNKLEEKPAERLIKMSKKRGCSISSLILAAILEYLKREEGKK